MTNGATGVTTSKLAVWSLICGILGCLWLPALVGLILGIVALVKINASEGRLKGTGLAIGGLATSVIMPLVGLFLFGILGALFLPALATARSKAQMAECSGKLRTVYSAMQSYKIDEGRYPDATGPAFFDQLAPKHLAAVPVCKGSGRSGGSAGYRGPAAPLLPDAGRETVIACDEPGTHLGAIMVLTGDGQVREVQDTDPDYQAALGQTTGR